jgi:hypothetical protein
MRDIAASICARPAAPINWGEFNWGEFNWGEFN